MEQTDDTDNILLKLLSEDAKLTVKELAAKVNLSTTPVFERIKNSRQMVISKSTLPY